MATYFILTCKACGKQVKSCDKTKTYVHSAVGIKFDHDVPGVISKESK